MPCVRPRARQCSQKQVGARSFHGGITFISGPCARRPTASRPGRSCGTDLRRLRAQKALYSGWFQQPVGGRTAVDVTRHDLREVLDSRCRSSRGCARRPSCRACVLAPPSPRRGRGPRTRTCDRRPSDGAAIVSLKYWSCVLHPHRAAACDARLARGGTPWSVREELRRLAQIAVIRVAVDHDRVDRRRCPG